MDSHASPHQSHHSCSVGRYLQDCMVSQICTTFLYGHFFNPWSKINRNVSKLDVFSKSGRSSKFMARLALKEGRYDDTFEDLVDVAMHIRVESGWDSAVPKRSASELRMACFHDRGSRDEGKCPFIITAGVRRDGHVYVNQLNLTH
jgi:hypothetical protein